jgi:putative transcriptional regulator
MNISKIKLNIIMASRGLNFIDLANLSKVSRVTLSYINNGKACRPDIAYKIATALNVNVTELIEE